MAKDDKAKDSSKAWSALSVVATLGSTIVAKKAMNAAWRQATGRKPPENPADPDVSIREAVAWAAFSGTFVAVMRMLAARKAATYYRDSTGHLPPGLQADGE